jgi:hypothetical protein
MQPPTSASAIGSSLAWTGIVRLASGAAASAQARHHETRKRAPIMLGCRVHRASADHLLGDEFGVRAHPSDERRRHAMLESETDEVESGRV